MRTDIINGKPNELFRQYGFIDIDKALDAFKYAAGIDKIDIKKINESSKLGKLYFDEYGVPFDDITDDVERLAKYMVVPTGYKSKDTGYPICASFIYDKITQWNGVYINNLSNLVKMFMQYSSTESEKAINISNEIEPWYDCIGFGYKEVKRINIENDNISSYIGEIGEENEKEEIINIDESLLENLYNRLIYKENWEKDRYYQLREYIKRIIQKVDRDIKNNYINGYIVGKNKDIICINSGLMDKYLNDIYLVRNKAENTITIVDAKVYLVNLGFEMQDIIEMPTTIKFYKDAKELIFSGNIREFDLENTNRLNHIIEERRHRFPEKYRDLKSDVLCSKIRASITTAIKMSEHDYKYFIPMYNFQRDMIQFLVPIYLDNGIDEKPEVVAIIDNINSFYSINTIISLEDAYNNARLICKPDTNWLSL